MNIFNVHENIISQYSRYISSFTDIEDKRIRDEVDAYFDKHRLWPQPLIQFNPAYAKGDSINKLCESGLLNNDIENVFKGYPTVFGKRHILINVLIGLIIYICCKIFLTEFPSAVAPKCFIIEPMACILFLN